MTFQAFASSKRPLIEKRLLTYLDHSSLFSEIAPWGDDVKNRLMDFVIKGKLLRGSLVLLGHEMFDGKTEADALTLAAGLELFHTSLLIHDDIMDQDRLRRGNKTFFAQYEEFAKEKGMSNEKRTGESLATCAGDIGFFLGFSLLNQLSNPIQKTDIMQLVTHELALVGLGQMQDVALGASTTQPTEDEILTVYRYKTARYTFSLPLVLGATLAEANKKTLEKITELGESVGTIYQIKDDQLNLFGDENETGKSVGSDIREGKKTLYYLYLSQDARLNTSLLMHFGNPSLDRETITMITHALRENGIEELLQKKIKGLSEDFRMLKKGLELQEKYEAILESLLTYSVSRGS